MKLLALITLVLAFNTTFAASANLDGSDLRKAAHTIFDDLPEGLSTSSVEAWESYIENDEVVVTILNHNQKNDTESLFNFDCHIEEGIFVCKNEGQQDSDNEHDDHDDHKHNHLLNFSNSNTGSEINDLELMKVAHQTALLKLAGTLSRSQSNINAVEYVKVWRSEGHDGHESDHEHGTDIWTKAIYTLNDVQTTVYVQCHQHAGKIEFTCHYITRRPIAQPELSDIGQDEDEHKEDEHGDQDDDHGHEGKHEHKH